jgi:hypothetical protein
MDLKHEISAWSVMKIDPDFDESYGCLHIFGESRNFEFVDKIRDLILPLYQKNHFKSLDWKNFLTWGENLNEDLYFKNLDLLFPEEDALLTLNTSPTFGSDDIILFPEATDGWYMVASRAFEWTLPGLNPLAVELSKTFPVLSTTRIVDQYDELCLYENGKAQFLHLAGLDPKKLLPEVTARPFDWNYFSDKGSAVNAHELKAKATDFDQMLKLAGPDAKGLRNSLLDSPIDDIDSEFLLIMRDQSFGV